jgi:hypothetical protein
VSCTVDVGATSHPLPAFHEYVNWLSASTAASDLECGQVNSLDKKMESLAEALDANPPAFERACGVSTPRRGKSTRSSIRDSFPC